ncbi:MAG: DUF427 domain-containing protein [Rhodospirillaceae bacterium]|nr:DUF427 domain-containing protein [Rhodospirillaceae bacterium]MBT3911151.1 DUF427 domain-containing protein [Rhodospirillaceae bacterium]MBT5513784.1 DUF427 domain-containing protein [Rhodospirillaceae bacterium]MBT6085516.1 DUF427 domain-containing protein [Rhodospirillaceae bacterium]MBT6608009.1 DUF427 domain-containing protein [Rhodospirillaceae bacterium]
MSAPMSAGPAPGFASHDGYQLDTVHAQRRIRVQFNDVDLADSARVLIVIERRHAPVFYFPKDDVHMDLLSATDHTSYCPFKGTASYWSITVGDDAQDNTGNNAVWAYEDPFDEALAFKGHLAFYWDRMSAWHDTDVEANRSGNLSWHELTSPGDILIAR